MYTHAVFCVSSVVGTRKARICRRIKAQTSLNCCGSHFFSHMAAAASDGSNDPAALVLVHLRFLLSHRIVEQHWHMHHKASASVFSLLAALPCGKIQSSRPRRKRSTLFSTVLFFGTLVIMVSAVSTATAIQSDQQLRPHCLFQPSGAGVLALSGAAWPIILVHSRLASFIRAQLGIRLQIPKILFTASQSTRINSVTRKCICTPTTADGETSHRDTCLTVEVPTPGS